MYGKKYTKQYMFAQFFLFGLTNNILYVVILSAAVDLVGAAIPKSVVLLADILPALCIKLALPFLLQGAYRKRVASLIFLSVLGMLLVAGSSSVWGSILGICLASLSSGLGEVTFLQLTHCFPESALHGWSSGTGGAGLLGSGSYFVLTNTLRLSPKGVLLCYSLLPLGFLIYYRLPQSYEPVDELVLFTSVQDTKRKIVSLLVPYMIPLGTVYFFEYLINQGVAPTLAFEGHPMRDVYVTYGALYQMGVFVSRSAAIRFPNLYLLSTLQLVNLVFAICQALFQFSSIYVVYSVIFYEGLIGGTSYINTFREIREEGTDTEFRLGAVSMSDSFGILSAALTGIWLEPLLCSHQDVCKSQVRPRI